MYAGILYEATSESHILELARSLEWSKINIDSDMSFAYGEEAENPDYQEYIHLIKGSEAYITSWNRIDAFEHEGIFYVATET